MYKKDNKNRNMRIEKNFLEQKDFEKLYKHDWSINLSQDDLIHDVQISICTFFLQVPCQVPGCPYKFP